MKYYALLLALPLYAQQLTMVSGNGQIALEYFESTAPLVVRVVDSAGRAVPDVPIAWSASPGGGLPLLRTTERTDSNGFASTYFRGGFVTPGYSTSQWTVTATSAYGSVNFFATSAHLEDGRGQPYFEVRPPTIEISGTPGSTFAEPILGFVIAQGGANQGSGIPNVGISIRPPDGAAPNSPTISCAGPGGVALTDERGRGECRIVFGTTPGGGSALVDVGGLYTRSISFRVEQGQVCNVTLTPSSLSFGASGGSGSFSVSALNCPWNVVPSATWISITSPGDRAGRGPGQVAFTIAPNTAAARTGTITVGNATFTVNQAASGIEIPLAFSVGSTLPAATEGIAYSATLSVSGGRAPYTWSTTGSVPPNLSLNTSTGALTGTPITPGTYSFGVTVRDAAGTTQSQTFTLQVAPASQNPGGSSISFVTQSLPPASLSAPYSQQVRATGGCNTNPFFGGVQLDLFSGTLPPGLQGQSGSGGTYIISGTATQPGAFRFAIRARDACQGSVVREYTINVGGGSSIPLMTASAIGLNFRLQRGATTGTAQTLTLSTGSLALPFQIEVNSTGNWLEVSPRSGQTSAEVTVRVVNTNLPAGTYEGTIRITSEAPNSPLSIPVTLTLGEPAGVVVTPNSLTFEYVPGGAFVSTQLLNIASSQGASIGVPYTVEATTREGGPWLSVNARAGTAPGTVAISVNPVGLASGSYSGTVAIQPAFNAAPVFVPVVLNVGVLGPQISSIVNAASFTGSSVAPGEIITIFGSSMGPATPQGLRLTPSGTVDTLLSEVRVWFDDQPAPLIYASATQISAIVPYSMGGRVTTRLTVEYRGVRSAVREVPVADSAPGIFTAGGGSQAAALNQDNTFNGPLSPARPGETISLFVTGEGQTNPGGMEGTIVPVDRLATPILPVTVTIGGRPARVIYAGSAPLQVAGLMQINAVVPAELTGPLQAVPVVLTVGTNASQAGVTITVQP